MVSNGLYVPGVDPFVPRKMSTVVPVCYGVMPPFSKVLGGTGSVGSYIYLEPARDLCLDS